MRRTAPLLGAMALAVATAAAADGAGPVTSLYTELSGPRCTRVREDRNTGSSVRACPGVARFRLLVATDDSRMSITVVTPAGVTHDLDYWGVVTRAFSTLGAKAEWRVIKRGDAIEPIALIVRVNASDQSDPSRPRAVSLLAVAKITREAICVTAAIPATQAANERARRAADRAAGQPCLTHPTS